MEFDLGHSDYEMAIMWKHHGEYASINIYPKPYKAHKFYKLTAINFCPYCGENLETNNKWYPKTLKELEENMELQKFEEQNLQVFKDISSLNTQIKELQAEEKAIKAQLEEAMQEHDIKSIDNDYIRITFVDESETVKLDLKEMENKEPETFEELMEDYPVKSIDLKRLEAAEPELHEELIADYPKVSKRKAHLRFKVK